MKPFLLALTFVLFGSAAWGNPIAQGAPVADAQLSQVKGSGLPDPWVITPYDQAVWVRFQMNLQCHCLSP